MMESNRVRVFDFDKNIPLEQQLRCPVCERDLEVACLLIGEKTETKIRYGLCTNCGYMGYMDRPSEKWMVDFYNKDWDKAFPKTQDEIKRGTILPGKGVKSQRYLTASLLEKINPDKNKTFCEIGSGYGEVLSYAKEQGFKTVVGVEHSRHRAELVHQALGFEVFHGEFENPKVQEKLSLLKPVGLFFSHHVLEHVYNPAEVIEKASSLQEIGDYFILSLPNAMGEHINYGLFYLVHLHSFTKESLELLLNRHGYEMVADNSAYDDNTIIAARKVQNPQPKLSRSKDYPAQFLKKIQKGMSIDSLGSRLQELYWEENYDYDFSAAKIAYGNDILAKVIWNIEKAIAFINIKHRRFTVGYKMLLKKIQSGTNLPIEIRFPDSIKLLMK